MLRAAKTNFERQNPNRPITLTFAAPEEISSRLATGNDAEIVISADATLFETLAAQDRLQEQAQIFATDPLVIVVARTNPGGVLELQDLNRRDLRVAIAAKDTVLGQQSRLMVANLNQIPRFRTDFSQRFLNGVIGQPSEGGGILNLVEQNRADVGIVLNSQAVLEQHRVFVLPVPPEAAVGVDYMVGELKVGPGAEGAQSFLDFLVSPQTQSMLDKYGLQKAP